VFWLLVCVNYVVIIEVVEIHDSRCHVVVAHGRDGFAVTILCFECIKWRRVLSWAASARLDNGVG
jgi:hypothetical protein